MSFVITKNKMKRNLLANLFRKKIKEKQHMFVADFIMGRVKVFEISKQKGSFKLNGHWPASITVKQTIINLSSTQNFVRIVLFLMKFVIRIP